jgi:hypothetical protein
MRLLAHNPSSTEAQAPTPIKRPAHLLRPNTIQPQHRRILHIPSLEPDELGPVQVVLVVVPERLQQPHISHTKVLEVSLVGCEGKVRLFVGRQTLARDDGVSELGREVGLGGDVVHVGYVGGAVHVLERGAKDVGEDVEFGVQADGDLEVFVRLWQDDFRR